MKKNLVLLAFLTGGLSLAAAEITQLQVVQMWPWKKTVAIDYTITGSEAGKYYDVVLKVTDMLGRDLTGLSTAQSGDVEYVSGDGKHRLVWEPEKSGTSDTAPFLKYTLTIKEANRKYLILDLSNGTTGPYTVSYLDEPPSGGFNVTAYKTEKMVFRRCRAGSYLMGSPTTEELREPDTYRETQHVVTFTNDFYLSIFELTIGNVARIGLPEGAASKTLDTTSTTAMYGLNPGYLYRNSSLTWGAGGYTVASGSLIGLMRSRLSGAPANYVLDLPTEAQWEYACRAGTTTAWNNGSDPNYHEIYGTGGYSRPKDEVCSSNGGDYTMDTLGQYACRTKAVSAEWTKVWYWAQDTPPGTVGRFLPNNWGFYDMHGNCIELLVEAQVGQTDPGSDPVVEPRNTGTSSTAAARGGGWLTEARGCRSACRMNYSMYLGNSQQCSIRLGFFYAPGVE